MGCCTDRMGMKNCLVLMLFCLLSGGIQASQDCRQVAQRCRRELGHVAPEAHCTEDGAIFPDVCQYREGRCLTGSPLKARGEACMQEDPGSARDLSKEGRSLGGSGQTSLPAVTRHKRLSTVRRPYMPSYQLSPFETRFFGDIIRQVDDRLRLSQQNGVSPEVAKKIYSVADHRAKTYTRSRDCFAYGLDLSPVSVWNSRGGTVFGGTLVSPRHLVWAKHFSLQAGDTLRFVDARDEVFERRLAGKLDVVRQGDTFFGEDLAVGVLDQDVPASVSFARVLPRDMVFLRPPRELRVPVLATDQEGKVLVADLFFQRHLAAVTLAPQGLRAAYFETKVPGDSGQPAFFAVDNQLVLIFINSLAGPGSGTPIAFYYDLINGLMRELGGDYQLTPVQLEAFGDRTFRPSGWERENYVQR